MNNTNNHTLFTINNQLRFLDVTLIFDLELNFKNRYKLSVKLLSYGLFFQVPVANIKFRTYVLTAVQEVN
jgi:hypothetical protein